MRTTLLGLFLSGLAASASAGQWYLIAVERAPLYKATAAYRVDLSLVQRTASVVSVWVRTDYYRPAGFKYPARPRHGTFIDTTALQWQRERFVVDCASMMLTVRGGSYVLAGDDVVWESKGESRLEAEPNTFSGLLYRLACESGVPREVAQIQTLASEIEKKLLARPQDRERIREERNRPALKVARSTHGRSTNAV